MNQFNRYRNFLMLFISCFLLNDTLIAAQSPLPDIGSSVNKHLSVNKEQLIGDVLVRQLKGQAPLLQDILVTDYLKTVGFKIVSQNPDAMNRKF
ncbi:MAG TPA: M48 family peptidase, partial [Aeromonadales bacterium]|nr:M48 family peptidase [Aeromonadales bacterium]